MNDLGLGFTEQDLGLGPAGQSKVPTTTLVDVALPLPIRRTFTYSVPGEAPLVGTRVLVPFRNRYEVGWIVGPGVQVSGVRPVLAVLDDAPTISSDLLELARWMADYYIASLGTVLRSMVPASLVDRSRDYVTLTRNVNLDALGTRQARIVEALEVGVPQSVVGIRKGLGKGSFWPELRSLAEQGVITHETVPPKDPAPKTQSMVALIDWIEDIALLDERFGRAQKQKEAYHSLAEAGGRLPLRVMIEMGFSRSVVHGLEDKGVVALEAEEVIRDPFKQVPPETGEIHTPTGEQKDVVTTLVTAFGNGGGTFLLHGITGSGKTLVYSELLRSVLAEGKGAIILVPEIALTPQTVARFRQVFGDEVAVLHSGLSDGERYDAWRQLKEGKRRIAIGPRSAVFAPVKDLGAIVVDEEHDGSYKQSEAPRYHGRDVAVVRAGQCGAVCVLGSATPSLESWVNAQSGKYGLLTLPNRVGGGVLPDVRVVDLRRPDVSPDSQAPKKRSTGTADRQERARARVLTPLLMERLKDRLDRREQSILLLNRRGYASFAMCDDCGEVTACHQCSVSLTFHRGRKELVCHHCGHVEPPHSRCGRCGSQEISYKGIGTEQVERMVVEAFPQARVARMDVDTTGGKWAHHEILNRMKNGDVDVLLGTQMIAKGLDFPNVTLVGVINADVGLHFPDFRASERTFQLLAQVAGRAGRSGAGGEVIVQTFVPEHYVIRAALGHDYRGFVDREMKIRETPSYPPKVRLARLLISSPDQREALGAIDMLSKWLKARGRGQVEILGPAPAPIERLHGRYRFHVLLRSPQSGVLGRLLRDVGDNFRPSGSDARLSLDRDPIHLL